MTSVANVSAIRVTSTTTADSVPSVFVDAEIHRLSPKIKPGESESYDLNTVGGLYNGNIFHGRITIPSTGSNANDFTQLTFVSNAKSRAIYSVGGTANAPSITYKGTEAF